MQKQVDKKIEVHQKLAEYRNKQRMAFERTQIFIAQKEVISYSPLKACVYDTLNESKRQTRDLMDRLSNCSHSLSPTPTNRLSAERQEFTMLNSNSQKKVR